MDYNYGNGWSWREEPKAFYRASHGTAILKVGRKYKCYGRFYKMNEVGKYCGYLLGTRNTIKQARDFLEDVVMFPLGAPSK
jgi:hypothetical protein